MERAAASIHKGDRDEAIAKQREAQKSFESLALLVRLRIQAMSERQRIAALAAAFGKYAGEPIKKPTGFLSSGSRVLKALAQRCGGRDGYCSRKRGGNHALCTGRVARNAARSAWPG